MMFASIAMSRLVHARKGSFLGLADATFDIEDISSVQDRYAADANADVDIDVDLNFGVDVNVNVNVDVDNDANIDIDVVFPALSDVD